MLASPSSTRPLIPLAPVLSASSFRRAAHAPARTVLDAGAHRLVTSGRVAIALALRELGVQAGDTVLVPAYHSPSMIPPVLWREATPVFYRVGPDARVDLDDDCAHAFIGEHAGQPLGSWGDYAIASSMKFFPIYEGGALVSRTRSLDKVRVHSAGAGFEAKALLNSLERGFAYGRLPAVQAALWLPLRAKSALWGMLKRGRTTPARALAPDSSDSSFNFDPRWLDKRSSLFARSMLTLASPARIQALRRSHYERLDAALRGLPGIRPLHAQLPDGACPWVYPLLADDPESLFARLKAAGVPLTRFGYPLWQGMDAATCPNAAMLSRQVLSLPCHQELRDTEVDWLVATVREAVLA